MEERERDERGRRYRELVRAAVANTTSVALANGLSTSATWARTVQTGSLLVNATPDFTEHHLVAYGATDLLAKVFDDAGRPALAEMGVASLPFNGAVEIEAVVEIHG